MGRILLTAICGAVLAVGLVGAAPPPSERAQAEQAKATRDLSEAVEALSRNVAAQSEAGKTSKLEAPCDPDQDRRDSDLCAQWKAADAARDAAKWAFWSTLVGLAGVVGLGWNIWQGRAALAKAREANEISRRSAERQLRAYLTIDDIDAHGLLPNAKIRIAIKVRNRGQTPATHIRMASCVIKCFDGNPDKVPIDLPRRVKHYDLGPDQSNHSLEILNERITQEELARIGAGKIILIFAGYFSYRDVFGRQRRVIFRANLDKPSIHNGQAPLEMSQRHCRST